MAATRIAAKSELPANNEAKEFTVGDKTICIANVDGKFAAMDNVCIHRGGPLGQGLVEEGKLVCPWHGWQYDPATGAAAHNPAAKVAIYSVNLEGDDVFVEM